MSYRLFIANKNYSSWSMRAWVALKALDIPFEEVLTPFEGAGLQTAFTSFSPTAKVPCLHEGDNVVWDSLAIIEYVAEAHPDLWPQSRAARAWARCATAEMHSGFPALRDECSMNCSLRIELGTPSEGLQRDLNRLETLWCEGLKRFGGPWLAGERFTAVDAFFAPVAVRIHGYDLPLGETALAYVQRLLEHPSVADWISQGIAEPWVDEPHEQDCLRGRRVLADRRA
ncbi:glutathione S-transferase family protein [Chromohalobacter canadensis]|uniref:Glutathione S-transferase family protein n=1 Tax=Chromohalobacter canadensis TaxID=141389 RepID=A0ABZ0YCR0_9GAMM|nr:glutathione S-transferase family protein [Chromohalobacter canadensis]MCK0767534.1 glutathione S-transferase family protein [Chromohalobacter canadensis]WQH09865.1 glutathione S-transferase family protein [Chromohalobacter canadensis]